MIPSKSFPVQDHHLYSICLRFWIIILFVFPVQVHLHLRETRKPFSFHKKFEVFNEDDTFIINLVNQKRFAQCSLLAFQDKFNNDHSVDRILGSAAASLRALKTVYSTKHSSAETVWPSERKRNDNGVTSNVSFPSRLYYRRLSSPCSVVILMVNDLRPEFIHEIYKILTPLYMPITRKDEDFYIFKTQPRYHKRLLLMKELPSRIKFKIAVGCETTKEETRVKVRTICFFCRDGGKPRLLTFSVTKLPVPDKDYFPDFVWNLNGKLIRVSAPISQSKIELFPPWKFASNARRGHYKMLFEEFLTVKFNFTYHMFVGTGLNNGTGKGGTGLLLPNGTWIGVTGDLIAGRADIGFSTGKTPSRIKYIGFTDSFYDTGCLTFVTAQPQQEYSAVAFLWPFDTLLWTGIGICTLLSIIFISTVFKIKDMFEIDNENKWPFVVQIQFLVSTFLEQDVPFLPKSQALRWFVSLWILFTMVLTNAYRSKMVELLAFPVMDKLPQTFEELAFSDYQVGFMKHGDAAYNTLLAGTDPVYKKLVAEMEVIFGVGLECLEKAVRYRYACIAYDTSLTHLREQNMTEADTRKLVIAPATTYQIYMGLAFEARSIYLSNFGKVLSRTRSFHLREIWNQMDLYYTVRLPKLQWWERTGQIDKTKHAEEPSDDLTLKHISGTFYVLAVSLMTSSLVFLFEKLSKHRFCLRFSLHN